MVSERDRILELVNYIESLGVEVNIGKNKARGNKGIFLSKSGQYRIDISKQTDNTLPTLLHEFAHYIHLKNDSSLKSLDFIFPLISEEEEEELIKVTVDSIPSDYANSLYDMKQHYEQLNKINLSKIKAVYPDFKMSKPHKGIEKSFSSLVRNLLNYDKIKFLGRVYSIKDFGDLTDVQKAYIDLRSNKRKITKINSGINRLNRYYNRPSELWARFFEVYITKPNVAFKLAPKLSDKFRNLLSEDIYPELSRVSDIINSNSI